MWLEGTGSFGGLLRYCFDDSMRVITYDVWLDDADLNQDMAGDLRHYVIHLITQALNHAMAEDLPDYVI